MGMVLFFLFIFGLYFYWIVSRWGKDGDWYRDFGIDDNDDDNGGDGDDDGLPSGPKPDGNKIDSKKEDEILV